jgi:hypothetical protein
MQCTPPVRQKSGLAYGSNRRLRERAPAPHSELKFGPLGAGDGLKYKR